MLQIGQYALIMVDDGDVLIHRTHQGFALMTTTQKWEDGKRICIKTNTNSSNPPYIADEAAEGLLRLPYKTLSKEEVIFDPSTGVNYIK